MLSIAHTIISIPFGLLFQNPILAFCAAFIMHFLCDRMLHWNIYPHKMQRYPYGLVALDVIGGLIAAYVITDSAVFNISTLAAIAGGNMPDVLHATWSALSPTHRKRAPKPIQRFFAFHEAIQRETDSIPKGLVSQILISGLAIILTRILI